VCDALGQRGDRSQFTPCQSANVRDVAEIVAGCQVIVSAGAAGIELVSAETFQATEGVRVAIDLNAVPPAGVAGIEVQDKATDRGGVICYGAIGVGGTKMKIHKAALKQLFESNDAVLDAEEILEIGRRLA
jgi:hypothetical protein